MMATRLKSPRMLRDRVLCSKSSEWLQPTGRIHQRTWDPGSGVQCGGWARAGAHLLLGGLRGHGLELLRGLALRLRAEVLDLGLAEDDVRVTGRALEHVRLADHEEDLRRGPGAPSVQAKGMQLPQASAATAAFYPGFCLHRYLCSVSISQ